MNEKKKLILLYFNDDCISDYQLTLRQQPKQSRMCGVGEKGIIKSFLMKLDINSIHVISRQKTYRSSS
jgi:hypothetical protein